MPKSNDEKKPAPIQGVLQNPTFWFFLCAITFGSTVIFLPGIKRPIADLIIQHRTKDLLAQMSKAIGPLEEGDASAVPILTKVIARYPDSTSALAARGLAFGMNGDAHSALSDLNRAIRLDPKQARLLCARAIILLWYGRADKAVIDLSHAISLSPDLSYAYALAGATDLSLSEDHKALADLNEALKLDPQDINCYLNRALTFRRLDESTRADADYQTAKQLGFAGKLPQAPIVYVPPKLYESLLSRY